MKILLGSGGISNEERLNLWRSSVDEFLGKVTEVLLVPYAVANHDLVLSRIHERKLMGERTVVGIHQAKDPKQAIRGAQAIFVYGGNTFRLQDRLCRLGLMDVIRERVCAHELLYVGVSAGSNVAGPTMMTTNDMPIVFPPTFDALGFLPVQLNPHYTRGAMYYIPAGKTQLEPYGGETRDDRLREFHEENTTPILAIDEGAVFWGEFSGSKWTRAELLGELGGRWFERGKDMVELVPGADLRERLNGI